MNITIIGKGRFGTYLADQLQSHTGGRPTLLGPNCPKERYQKAPTTILCVPMRDLQDCLETVVPNLRKNSVLMDTCSVKTLPLQAMIKTVERHGRHDIAIAGIHPLFGPQSAPNSCGGQRTAVCMPPGHQVPANVSIIWEEILKTLLIECTAEEHDTQMATQLINHFVGRITKNMGIDRVPLSTRTHDLFMDIQEIVCGNSQELFEDMNRFNPQAQHIREAFILEAQKIHQQLLGKTHEIHP